MAIKPLNLGIVGYGHYVRTNFVYHIKNLPHINIVGVYNRGKDRLKEAQEDGFNTFDTYEELLAHPDIEAVYIGTANIAHKEQAIMAAKAGKHIFCEKPLSIEYDEIVEMVDAAKEAGVVTHVNHAGPYAASFKKIKELIDTRLGKIQHIWVRSSRLFGNWANGARHVAVEFPETSGGWTLHHLCHSLNEAVTILGSPKAKTVFHTSQKSTEDCPSEEFVNALVVNEDGTTILVTDGTTIGGFVDFGAVCINGDLRLVDNKITIVTHGEYDPYQRPGNKSQIIEEFELPKSEGKNLDFVTLEFTKAVRGLGGMVIDFEGIKDQYKVLNAMRKSSNTGKSVDII